MKTSKIVDLLKTFSKAEWRDCTNFLAWKYKETGLEWELFKYLKKFRNDWENEALRIETVIKQLVPNLEKRRFQEKRSRLKSKLDAFLVYQKETNESLFQQQLILGEIYKERGLYNLYKDLQKPTKKSADNLKSNDLFTNLKLLLWHHQRYFSEAITSDNRIESLRKANYYLDQFHQNLKFYYQLEIENLNQLFYQEVYSKSISNKSELNILLTELKKLISNKEVSSFEILKKDLKEQTAYYSRELQQVILLSLINACSYFIRAKQFSYGEEALELYEFGLQTGITLYNGKLSERRFLNMVDLKSKSVNIPDSNEFIDEWLKVTNTQPKHEKTFKNLAKAIWYFAKELYRESYEHTYFVEITLKDANISHRVRLIKICSLYSLDNNYPLFRKELKNAKDFYTYTSKKKELSPHIIEGAGNLITILEKLWNKEGYDSIKNFKEECNYIVHEFWVEKILKKMAQKK